jgi:UDP-N-acetylmuramate: L-alanyl-gamma-D-glutamyl-meso-diaminopimelate ligase
MDELMRAFRWLLRIIPRSGRLIVHAGDPNAMTISREAPCPVVTCGLHGDADWEARAIRVEAGMTRFQVVHRGRQRGEAVWPLPGRHNVINGLLSVAAAHEAGVLPEIAIPALATFQGVTRRLEYLGEFSGVRMYDDFAHHPTAIRVTLEALRGLYPGNRIWSVVEPRSNTMCRRIFQGELPGAFAAADRVVLGAVHRADRLLADQRLDPHEVVDAIRREGKEAWHIPDVAEIVGFVKGNVSPGDVVCFMSNGAFGNIQRLLRDALTPLEDRNFPPHHERDGGFRPEMRNDGNL